MNPAFKKIVVLAGGPSCEREVSLVSGQAVYEALKSKGFSVFLIDPAPFIVGGAAPSNDGASLVAELRRQEASMAFIALHGVFGEDGTVQRLLEEAEIPYTGPGAQMSERAFDKSQAQEIFKRAGVRVPDFICVQKDSDAENFKIPCVVKPAKAGSSVGITLVLEKKDLKSALTGAFQYSDTVLVDEYIQGRELTVGILGEEALPVVEIIPSRKFYDYEAKYGNSGTRYEFPAKLTPEQAEKVTVMALKAYQALQGEVLSRVDLLLDAKNDPYVLEVNTIPGLTGKSLLPKAAKAKGIDFPELCVRILELSFERKKHGQTVKT